MKQLRLCLVLFFLPAILFAQRELHDADRAFMAQQYYNAELLYMKAIPKIKQKDQKARASFMVAECFRMLTDWQAAESWYQKSIKQKHNDDRQWLYLAQVQQMNGKCADALASYQEYKTRVPSDPAADIGIESCNACVAWQGDQCRWKIENEAQLNTKSNDFCPTWADRKHKSLVFTSKRAGQTGSKVDPVSGGMFSDIFEARVDNKGKWSTPAGVTGNVNLPSSNDGASCITKNGAHIFFTRCEQKRKGLSTCKIYYAEKQGNTWGIPVLVDFGLDPETLDSFNFRHPAVSITEDVMVFSSDMTGSTGGVKSDLWMSTFDKKTKKWSTPVNMGSQFNTQQREGFPYISDDGSLYFSSDGRVGMGGLDIFRAPKVADNGWKWGAPENLKAPFNSTADDFGIVFDGKLRRGYLTSNRSGTKGLDDIWRFYYDECKSQMSGVVEDSVNHVPVKNALVELIGNDGSVEKKFTAADGSYKFTLRENVLYILNVLGDSATSVKAENYFSLPEKDKGKVSTMSMCECKDFVYDFFLPPIPKDVEIILPAVLYGLDSANLRPESKDSLNFLYQLLIDNPNFVIELNAHTDCQGSAAHNRDLAQRRAQACVDYLISKGIAPERLIAKGFGEDRPLKLPNGQVLTERYINTKKTVQEREALHQLNRRTTFRVVRTNYVDPKNPSRGPIAPVEVKKGFFDDTGEEEADAPAETPQSGGQPQVPAPKRDD